jgi:hypothetical protein
MLRKLPPLLLHRRKPNARKGEPPPFGFERVSRVPKGGGLPWSYLLLALSILCFLEGSRGIFSTASAGYHVGDWLYHNGEFVFPRSAPSPVPLLLEGDLKP